jgi:hypothetical protein
MAVAALALGLGLGACAQGNTPDAYGTLTQQNFLESCTNFYFDNTDDTLAITDNTVTDDAVNPPDQQTCQCMYDLFTGPNPEGDGTEGGMPINETVAKTVGWTGPNFTDLNSDLKNDPQKAWDSLPEDPWKNGITACADSGGRSSGQGDDSPTTSTTVATDGSTTTTGA